MRSLLARTVAPLGLVVILAACGGGSSEEVTSGPPGNETTTTGAASDITETAVSTTIPGQSTDSSVGPATSTSSGGGTATTKSPPRTPGTPGTPVTGPLVTPPTVRAIDPYLPPGVVDQVNPPGTLANELLWNRRCGALLRQIRGPITKAEEPTNAVWAGNVRADLTNLYLAAGEVCLSNWAAATAAFQKVSFSKLCQVDPEDPDRLTEFHAIFQSGSECRNTRESVYHWTERLLKAKAANPAFVPNFQPPPER